MELGHFRAIAGYLCAAVATIRCGGGLAASAAEQVKAVVFDSVFALACLSKFDAAALAAQSVVVKRRAVAVRARRQATG
jgi:hypothetical protein